MDAEKIDKTIEKGTCLIEQGDYLEAIDLLKPVLQKLDSSENQDKKRLSKVLLKLGEATFEQSLVTESIAYTERALAIRKTLYESVHDDIAECYNNLSNSYLRYSIIYKKSGIIEKSEDFATIAYDMYKLLYGVEDNIFRAGYHHRKGNIETSNKNSKEAYKHYQIALKIRRHFLNGDHRLVARTLMNIGQVLLMSKKYDEALVYLEESMKVMERLNMLEHPDMGAIYGNMGRYFFSKNKLEESIVYFSKGTKILEKKLGLNSIQLSLEYHNLARASIQKGDLKEGKIYLHKSLNIRTRLFGYEHLDTASILNDFNIINIKIQDYASAFKICNQIKLMKLRYERKSMPLIEVMIERFMEKTLTEVDVNRVEV